MNKNKYAWLEFNYDENKMCSAASKVGAGQINGIYKDAFVYGCKLTHEKDKVIMLKLLEIIEIQNKALKYYALKSNYSIVNEGRNYSDDYKAYELCEEFYNEKELGTKSKQTLAKTTELLNQIGE